MITPQQIERVMVYYNSLRDSADAGSTIRAVIDKIELTHIEDFNRRGFAVAAENVLTYLFSGRSDNIEREFGIPREFIIVGLLIDLMQYMEETAERETVQPAIKTEVEMFAHRGCFTDGIPESSIPAFKKAMEMGLDGFELDVHMTRDGVVMVSHHESLEDLTDGTGWIEDYTLDEAKQLRLRRRRGSGESTNLTIPTLQEVFDLTKYPQIQIQIHVENIDYVDAVLELVNKNDFAQRVTISSMGYFKGCDTKHALEILAKVREKNKDVKTALILSPQSSDRFPCDRKNTLELLKDAKKVDVSIFDLSLRDQPQVLIEETVRLIHERGIAIGAGFQAADEDLLIRMTTLGADRIISESPEEMARVKRMCKVMRQRFDDLKHIPVKAVVFDVDGNLTDGDRKILPEAIEMILLLRELEIPVVLTTGRMYKLSEEMKTEGRHDLEEVLIDIHKEIPFGKRRAILSGLYACPENGLCISNGFLRGEDGYISYTERIFEILGIARNIEREERLKDFLANLDFEKLGLFVEWCEAKELSFTILDQTRNRQEHRVALRAALPGLLRENGLWDENITISESDNAIEVSFYKMDKSNTLVLLDKILGIKNDNKGIVITSGDNGQKGGNDNPMLARKGGLSSDKFDSDDPNIIALQLISGEKTGFPSVQWAIRQFKYRTPEGRIAMFPTLPIPTQMEQIKPDEISITDNMNLTNRASKYLRNYHVDMTIDLSLIPEEDLEANMRTWAYIIALHKNKYGLDVSYILNFEDKAKNATHQRKREAYRVRAKKLLLKEISSLSNVDKKDLKSRIKESRSEDKETIDIRIMALENLRKMRTLPKNMLPVPMKKLEELKGVPVWDFHAASAIGLAQAACKKAQMDDEKDKSVSDKELSLPRVIKAVFPIMRDIYKKLIPHEIVTEETIYHMIDENPTARKNLAISLALPPIAKVLIEHLRRKYHNQIHLLLSNA